MRRIGRGTARVLSTSVLGSLGYLVIIILTVAFLELVCRSSFANGETLVDVTFSAPADRLSVVDATRARFAPVCK